MNSEISLAFKIAASAGDDMSLLIAKVTDSPYSHVELAITDPTSPKTLCWSSRGPYGVSPQYIDLTGAGLWTVVQIPDLNDAECAAIFGYCHGANGKNYDFKGLLGYATQEAWHADADVFCSEFCVGAFQAIGRFLGRDPWMVSPGDLYEAVTGTAKWVTK